MIFCFTKRRGQLHRRQALASELPDSPPDYTRPGGRDEREIENRIGSIAHGPVLSCRATAVFVRRISDTLEIWDVL